MAIVYASGESLRLLLWIFSCAVCVYPLIAAAPTATDAFAFTVVVMIGTLSWFILPNWLVIGARTYEAVLPLPSLDDAESCPSWV